MKAKALLAAGMVLGIGASSTLASWSHDSHIGTTITTANFLLGGQLQVNPNNTNDAEFRSFDPNVPHQMAMWNGDAVEAGGIVTAAFHVRLDPASNLDIDQYTIEVTGVDAEGPNAEHLEYQAHIGPSGSACFQSGTSNASPHINRQAITASPSTLGQVQVSGRTTTRRVCLHLFAGDGILPNDEIDISVQLTARPVE